MGNLLLACSARWRRSPLPRTPAPESTAGEEEISWPRLYVRTVAAAALAACSSGQVVGGREHEQAGVGVEVAGLVGVDGSAVAGEDLRTAGVVERQAARMGLEVARHPFSLADGKPSAATPSKSTWTVKYGNIRSSRV